MEHGESGKGAWGRLTGNKDRTGGVDEKLAPRAAGFVTMFVTILIVHAQRIRVARDHASAPRTRTLDAAHLAFDQIA